jgi:hypothetical protein
MNLESIEAPLRRRDTLQTLLNSRDYTASEVMLRNVLREVGRYAVSGAKMRDDLFWLAERQLVKTHETAGLLFATLLERGRDVAQGDERIVGIAMPEVDRA